MTLRYRCPWCRTVRMSAPKIRFHIMDAHRAVLIRGLGILETFGTRKEPDPPRNAAKPVYGSNRGVGGEGDS